MLDQAIPHFPVFKELPENHLDLLEAFNRFRISVYKSQGSEFDHVLLLLADGMQSFGKEALYTGVTRAKKRLEIWCNPQVLQEMIQISAVRQSGVVARLSA